MIGRQPRDKIGQRLHRYRHGVRIRVNQSLVIGHESDMVGEEQQVAALERLISSKLGAQLGRLLQIGIARHIDAGTGERDLDQPRTIDAVVTPPTPQIGRPTKRSATATGSASIVPMGVTWRRWI